MGGGYTFYLIMKYPFSCVCAFEQPRPYFLFHICKNVFHSLCNMNDTNDIYLGETCRCLEMWVKEHNDACSKR